MGHSLEPARALDPGRLTGLYLGALGLETPERRLAAAETVCCLGRLGLRPDELLHLQAGWIDWEHGELRVPERDPCACAHCWERARVAQRDGDGRPLADIVAEDYWPGRPRAIPFGWAPRLTAVLANAVDAWDYLDATGEDLRRLLVESAERATTVEPAAVDVSALRSSAATCYADAGFDAPRVADVMGIDVETAAAFTAQQPGRARTHLYRTFDAEPPAVAGEGERYPLLTGPEPLDNEAFDPTEYDADWRADRAAAADDPPERSPRPAIEPENAGAWTGGASVAEEAQPGADAEAARPVDTEEADAEADAGSAATKSASTADETSTADRTDAADDAPSGDDDADVEPESGRGDPVDAEPSGPAPDDVDDLASLATEPLALDFATRFAGTGVLEGRPAGGRVLLGAAELVLGAHGGGRLQAVEVVQYADVRDLAVDWAPDRIEAIFGDTIGLAIEGDEERDTLVIEIPDGRRTTLVRRLFEGLLDECPAIVRHPATVGGHVTDREPVGGTLVVDGGRLAVEDAGEDAPTISLADVVGVERETLTTGGEVHGGIRVDHLAADGRTIGTFLGPRADRDRRLLERYVVADHRDRERRVAEAELAEEEHEVLEALETSRGRRDLAKLLGMDRQGLSSLLDALSAAGFVHSTPDGVRLTGMGRLAAGTVTPDGDA
jgi:helix-turn-helix protein